MTPKSITQTTGNIFEFLLFGVLFCFFFVIISPLLPTKQYIATFAVASGSMEPNLPIGSLAFVQQKDASQLKVGDIITFPEPNNPRLTIIHRITAINSSGGMIDVRTKGDNNPAIDDWRINAQIISGQMIASVPYIGYPIMFAQTPTG
ncbi:MAG: signal peptidase I, partial [Candidatus Pacebacteria bacterium CG_4_10_14_0_8_um_filter_43_12]